MQRKSLKMEEHPTTWNVMNYLSDELNRTEARFPHQATLVELFRKQAAKTPGSSAVISSGCHLSYEQLDAFSNRIARAIRVKYRDSTGKVIEAGTPIGIYLERGADAICAILGILKAGAAYVPLDPDYPIDRIKFVAESTGLPLVVTRRDLLSNLSDIEGLSVDLVLKIGRASCRERV